MKEILNLNNKINKDKTIIESLFNESKNKALIYQKDYNSFVTICDFEHIESNSLLNGIPYGLKDIFSTKGILTTGSSNILKSYVPVYDSTVYKKLKDAGAVLIGKTVLDELAMGGTGTTGHTGIVRNPWNKERQIGGSSAGSAAAVSLDIVPFAIGSDTGDSVRKPAGYAGVVGFKPTYGRISRYGLFPFASSLDHVGIFAKSVEDVSVVADVLKGYDEKDMTSIKEEDVNYLENINNNISGKKLFYIKEILEINSDNIEVNETIKNFFDNIEKIKELGVEVKEISFDKKLLNAMLGTYYSISCAEATSNNSNLTGIPFGERIEGNDYKEIMINTRTAGFSELIKRRFVLGSYILKRENQEKLYLNALRVRRLIVEKLNDLFNKYDGLILPTTTAPFLENNVDQNRINDEFLLLESHLVIGNFGGYPSITIPSGIVNNMPIGINITCGQFNDSLTLNIANKIEEIIKFDEVGEKNV